ncbi:MAG: hypothetical protein M1814_000360 [Vezdaea aestivalis]|nr:MAG: hypothetical protein M1814_000360 [Vezdaea aestivalis]
MTSRKDFLNQPAPENYVAGLGRGATGFVTRSDLGPGREGPSEDQIKEALAKRAQVLGVAPPTAYGATAKKEDDNDEARFQDPENEVGLFASGAYDKDDDEADRIYQEVDERMDRRRKIRRGTEHTPSLDPEKIRFAKTLDLYPKTVGLWVDYNPVATESGQEEAREQAETEEYERKNPKIGHTFTDLKRALNTVSDDEWANLPEVGDLTGKNRRTKANLRQRLYAVPDSVIAGARDSNQFETSVTDDGQNSHDNADGTMTNFAEIGAARDKVLKVKLDQAAQGSSTNASSGTATTVDPKGYLTSLVQSQVNEDVQIGDINRIRGLLESVIKTNPKHAPGWIAAARLEEVAGKIVAARNVMERGCSFCPKSEDAWLESIRLNETHNGRIIAARAVKHNPKSVRLWTAAMQLENTTQQKKRVLRLALDSIPQSVALWKEAVNLEADPEDARLLLGKATEIIPLSIDLWLALARLETPEHAQIVLNKARKAIPTSHEIWIAAARLQEQIGNSAKVNVMKRAVTALAKESAMLPREDWIREAEKCESEGAPMTCQAIVRETLGYGLDEDDDRKKIFLNDAKESLSRDRIITARAIHAYALRLFPTKKSLWLAAADLERSHGSKEALWELLDKGTEACPDAAVLWMQLAREKWSAGELDAARLVLARAFKQNPNNEDIWLSAVTLEASHGQTDQARSLLAEARAEAGTDRVWVKSVAFERSHGSTTTAMDLVAKGLSLYPNQPKLHMLKGQLFEADGKKSQARTAYSDGTRACPRSVPLWLLAARLEERSGVTVKARSVLDRARLTNSKNDVLWTESVRVERRAALAAASLGGGKAPPNFAAANNIMARALQECPTSGLLWSERIMHLEARTARKPRALEAVRKCDNDTHLFVTVGRIFWSERRVEKAGGWFEKALILDPSWGDGWAWYWHFLKEYGTEEKRKDVLAKCEASEPKFGEVWQSIRKKVGNEGWSTKEVLEAASREVEAADTKV